MSNRLVSGPLARVTSLPSKQERPPYGGVSQGERPMKMRLLASALVAGFAADRTAAQAAELKLMTGPQGGSGFRSAASSRTCGRRRSPGCRCRRCPAPASPMCAASRKARPISASATRSRRSTRLPAMPPFNKPHANVCNVATLYPQYFQVVVRADAGINSVKDLKGKASPPSRAAIPARRSPSTS